ncbi:uncharacterized protein [Apostichopus japonicus]|uniref:uncharacterized protein n=1 Tax=Stichopus japonicus TaxID=307972 RepID=UPI003AB36372
MDTDDHETLPKAPGQDKAPRHLPKASPVTSPPVSALQQASSRRKIFAKPPRLESVSESDVSEKSAVDSPSTSSSDFGVRSYLHHFYEDEPKEKSGESVFESGGGPIDSCAETVKRCASRNRHCSPIWWKAGAWVGFNILFLALIAISVSYLVKPRPTNLYQKDDIPVVDQEAKDFNKKLNAAKVGSLVLLCVGGLILTISLLLPTLGITVDPDEIHVDPSGTFPPYMPLENNEDDEDGIPYTSKLTSVQPQRAKGESVVAGKDMVKVQE